MSAKSTLLRRSLPLGRAPAPSAPAPDAAFLSSLLGEGATQTRAPATPGPAPTPAPSPTPSTFFPPTRTAQRRAVPREGGSGFFSPPGVNLDPNNPNAGIGIRLPAPPDPARTGPRPVLDAGIKQPGRLPAPGDQRPRPSTPEDGGAAPGGDLLQGPVNPQTVLASVQAFGPPTAATLDAWWAANGPALSAQGYRYIPHPTDPAFVLPDGTHIDLIQGGGGPSPSWQWLVKGAGGSGSGSGGFGFGSSAPTFGTPPPRTASGQAVGAIDPTTPSIFPGSQQIEVGQDPLSELLNSVLGDLLQTGLGERGSTLFDEFLGIINRGGDLDEDTQNLRFESARELLDRGRTAQTNQIRANLAARNLLSEPGIPQGAELGALTRLEGRLGEDFARALRDIAIEGQQAADTRLAAALATASGLATTEARTILDSITAGTERQAVLSGIALDVLDRNILWNQFLAEFGLQRAQALDLLQSGRIDDVEGLLELFLRFVNQAAAGQTAPA